MKEKVVRILQIITIWTIVYFTIYLFKSFVQWNLTNPFEWILLIKTSQDVRIALSMFVPVMGIMSIGMWYNLPEKD